MTASKTPKRAVPCPNPHCRGTGYELNRYYDPETYPNSKKTVLCRVCHGRGTILVKDDR